VVPAAPPLPEPSRPFPAAHFIPLPGRFPEDVVVGHDGMLYCGVDGGSIVQIDPDGHTTRIVADTGGRPLGLEPAPDGLIVCDAYRGLLSVDVATGAVTTLVSEIDGVPLNFCSNAALAPDGAIWFTESSTRFGFDHYLGAFLEHRPSGRLLRHDVDGTTSVILTDLDFPNGLALTPSRDALILVETAGYRLSRVNLSDARRTILAENLPGYPDNLSQFRDWHAWVALTNPRSASLDRSGRLPGWIRRIAWRLPDRLMPGPDDIVWLRSITADGEVIDDIHTHRDDYEMATGAVEYRGFLYVAGLRRTALLRLDLSALAITTRRP
jgi:sugar lactone lactonase YvrE